MPSQLTLLLQLLLLLRRSDSSPDCFLTCSGNHQKKPRCAGFFFVCAQ
jgi:hypothetical protein